MSQGQAPLRSRIGYVVKGLQQVLRVAMDTALSTDDLSMTQFAALTSLLDGPLSPAELARRCFTTRQSMHEVLISLQARGFVERAPQPSAGRAQPIALTGAGIGAVEGADHAVRSVEARMTRTLTPVEQDQLLAWLHACVDNLRRPDDG